MKKFFTIFVIVILYAVANAQAQVTIFQDHFLSMNNAFWHIPTWVSNTDGTYVGRTQFRCTQNAQLPSVANSEVSIDLDTYNPTGFSFYGTDLISNRTFLPGNGLVFTIHARMKTPIVGGMVGGIFSYDVTGSNIHDEIDFELVTNHMNSVSTNVYSDQPLGVGVPDSSALIDPITSNHIYVIEWLPNKINWFIDGTLVRTETITVDGAMHFHLNLWVPGTEWPYAYNAGLQPVNSLSANTTYSMLVDLVQVDSLISTNTIAENRKIEPEFYPNPAHDEINFTTPVTNLIISSINGDMIENKQVTDGKVSVNNLAPGMYIVRYESENTQYIKKLIIY
jgi:beta-glucanase (GH16 family)